MSVGRMNCDLERLRKDKDPILVQCLNFSLQRQITTMKNFSQKNWSPGPAENKVFLWFFYTSAVKVLYYVF
jgi:hypothetical protein